MMEELIFPPGFRFHPSDEELIVHYLQNKINSHPLPAPIVAEIDLYKFNPWELPKKALFGEDEWYFFSPRDRKYPNGLRPNRAAASGYWKATGTDKPILTRRGSNRIGLKKALVFYSGRPPRGTKTDWIMDEYRLVDSTSKPSRFKGSMRLDDWVLCRVRYKGYSLKNRGENHENNCGSKLLANLPTNTDSQGGMITDYQIFASILVDEPVLHSENTSSMNFRGSKGNNFTSVYEDAVSKVNPQMTIPDTLEYSYFDSLKRKSNEDNQHENLVSFNRKLNAGNKIEDPPNKVPTNTDTNCYNQNQSPDGILNENTPDSSINFQELNELAYTGRYMQ